MVATLIKTLKIIFLPPRNCETRTNVEVAVRSRSNSRQQENPHIRHYIFINRLRTYSRSEYIPKENENVNKYRRIRAVK